jgi:hypothetical protein
MRGKTTMSLPFRQLGTVKDVSHFGRHFSALGLNIHVLPRSFHPESPLLPEAFTRKQCAEETDDNEPAEIYELCRTPKVGGVGQSGLAKSLR